MNLPVVTRLLKEVLAWAMSNPGQRLSCGQKSKKTGSLPFGYRITNSQRTSRQFLILRHTKDTNTHQNIPNLCVLLCLFLCLLVTFGVWCVLELAELHK